MSPIIKLSEMVAFFRLPTKKPRSPLFAMSFKRVNVDLWKINDMKYPIKEYKGQQIYYDDNYDKFVCDLELNDNLRSTKRNKLEDVEKEIDSFIKVNYKFVPFTAFYKSYDMSLVRIVSIRTDGVLVSDSKSQYKPSDFDKFYIADDEILKELKLNNDTFESARTFYNQRKTELLSNLKQKDMSSYNLNN